jgi:hypothetical protein
MSFRRLGLLLALVVSSAFLAACASSGSGGGGYAGAGAFAECESVYPPGSPYVYSYGNSPYGSGPGYYEDGLCSYPLLYDGSFSGAISVPQAPRAVTTTARHREHRAQEVTRPDSSDRGRSSDASSSAGGSSMPSAPVNPPAPRMEPMPVSAPAPSPPTIQPRTSN